MPRRARTSLRHNIIHLMSATCQDDLIKSRDYDSTSAAAYQCISVFIYLFSLNPPSCALARPLTAHLITTFGGMRCWRELAALARHVISGSSPHI